MLHRKLFVLALVILVQGCIAWPVFAQSTSEVIPEYNPVCWHKDDCVTQRKAFDSTASPKDLEDGWIQNEGECKGTNWGKCLPAGQTKTQISFAGRTQFLHIGDFISTMYKYAIGVAAVVAVLVIILSGFQWALSGGNTETITHSKTRIAGALIGLLIAYFSYFILNTLNPNLVNFRLPNVWMLKPQAYAPTFCSQTNPKTKFAFAKDYKDQSSPVKADANTNFDMSLEDQSPANLQKFYCGHRFFVQGGGNATCYGNYCGSGTVCVGFGSANPANPYHCVQGTVTGKITYTSPTRDPGCVNPFFNGWAYPKMVDLSEEELWWVAEDGTSEEITGTASGQTFDDHQEYVLSVAQEDIARVKSSHANGPKIKGYVVKFEMNKSCYVNFIDQDHWVGYDGSKAVDLGTTDVFKNVAARSKVNAKYLIPPAMVENGLELNVEAANIHHSSENFDYSQYYK